MKPVMFLDFDRTLFDTDKFYEWIGDNRVEKLAKITSGELSVPDFSYFLYPDTIEFLQWAKRSYKIVLLTYTINIELQNKKINGTKIQKYIDEMIMVSGGPDNSSGKGRAAREYLLKIDEPGWEHIFIDDSPHNIDEVKKENPSILCIRIDRITHAQGALHGELVSADHVISNLGEFISIT